MDSNTHVLRDSLPSRLPLEGSLITSDALKRLQGVQIKVAIRVFGRVVGEEPVSELVRRGLDSKMGEGIREEVSVRSYRVLESRAAEGKHDCEIVSVRTLRHGDKLFELGNIQRPRIAAT